MNIKNTYQGFTIVEVLLASSIFSIIAAVIAYFAVFYFGSYSFSFEEQQVISEASGTVTRMTREIRKAQTGADGSWPVVQALDNSFIFFAEVTGDSRVDRVRYFVDGTTLKKGIIEPATGPSVYPLINERVTTVVQNIDTSTDPVFRYYNGNWPGDTTNNPLSASQRVLNTRFVQIHIKLNPTPNYSAKPFELSTGVSIRSLKDNL